MAAEPALAPIHRVPPNSIDAEASVLGGIFLDPEAMASVVEILRPDDFYRSAHAKVYEAMRECFARGEPCDALMVPREMERRKTLDDVGGRPFLASLAQSVTTAANATHHASVVREKSLMRQVIGAGMEMTRAAYDEEGRGEEIVDRACALVRDVAVRSTTGKAKAVKDLLVETMAEMDGAQDERCVFTGFHALDSILGPLVPGSMNVLGARPSMGKTALALNIATSVAAQHGSVLFCSAEQPRREIVKRILSNAATVELNRMRSGVFLSPEERDRLTDAGKWLKALPLWIDDTSAPSPDHVRAAIMRQQQRQPVRLVVVDYLGLMRPPDSRTIKNRENEVGAISRGLKAVAKDCEVAMLVLSQLSRESAKTGRDDKADPGPPRLTDLRDSGSIEQDADVVMFLHRPNYFTKRPDDVRRADVVVRKNRNGDVGDVVLDWIGAVQRFENLANGGV